MKSQTWTKVIRESADPERAGHYFELLAATKAGGILGAFSGDQARNLAALFSGSQSLSVCLISHPDWLDVTASQNLAFPRRKEGVLSEAASAVEASLLAKDYDLALARLRQFKQREMLRIGARDLARLGSAVEIMQEISNLADVCLEFAWRICRSRLVERYGEPWHQDANGGWLPTRACLMGLGKLGGRELNYSSDVDVVFVYEEEGNVFKVPPPSVAPCNLLMHVHQKVARGSAGLPTTARRGRSPQTRAQLEEKGKLQGDRRQASPAVRGTLSNHQFFNRFAEALVAEVTRLSAEGVLYRIDLRLRPEGDAGPLSCSLAAYENYYGQWGQTWERMMLIKARKVAGDEALAAEFLEMVQPFRYPRSINENALREVAEMKGRIENEVIRAGELERNVKLGRGGIREIEFIVQVLQLLQAGRQPFLQEPQTLPGLQKLAEYELLPPADAAALADAYRFLRDLEHRLQMEDNRQTHTIPTDRSARERLARLMEFLTRKAFDEAFRKHTSCVRRVFDRVLRSKAKPSEARSHLPRRFQDAEEEWKAVLAKCGFADTAKAFRLLREFVEGPGYVHVSRRTQELARQLVERLFELCAKESGVQSPKSKVQSPEYGVRNRRTKDRTRDAMASESRLQCRLSDPDRVLARLDSYIAAYGARGPLFEVWNSNPSIFEMLVLLFDRSEFLAERAIRTPDLVDELVTGGRLRQSKPAEETLRDLRHGLEDADQHQWLRRYHQAELLRIGLRDILGLGEIEQYLSELSALADACLQYALEVIMRRHRLKKFPFVVGGLGKLGGQEIDYGSDLDIIFIGSPGAKNLAKLGRLAVEVMDLLSARTEDGVVFHTDARLRPDGEKGLLVNSLDAYEAYYRRRSQLWEIQSLTRTRPVAGDPGLGEQFQRLAASLTNFSRPSLPLAAFTPEWKQKIHLMRLRIEKERTPKGKDELAIKTGEGGLMDAEFIAQTLCLEHGWQEANTLRALQRAQTAGSLARAGELIENYRRLRRVEGILRRWSYEGETVLPDDPAAYYRVAMRCGFETAEAFREAVAGWRKAIRERYWGLFGAEGVKRDA